jgi:hypothetical protein
MDDSSTYNNDVPLEIVVVHWTTQVEESTTTTSSVLLNDGLSSTTPSVSSTTPSNIKPSNIMKTCEPLPVPLPSKEMMESRWVSSPHSEKCKQTQQQASPRLPRRSRTQPLECPTEFFQIGTDTRKIDGTNSWIDESVMDNGHHDENAIQQRKFGRASNIVRTKSDGYTTRKKQSKPMSSRSVHALSSP